MILRGNRDDTDATDADKILSSKCFVATNHGEGMGKDDQEMASFILVSECNQHLMVNRRRWYNNDLMTSNQSYFCFQHYGWVH